MYALKEETLMEGIFNGSTKVCSILFSYFIYMRLDINESISFAQKNKNKIKKERKKFSVRFGKCSVFFLHQMTH